MMRLMLALLVVGGLVISSGASHRAHAGESGTDDPSAVCGDSEPDPGEGCDDGNTSAGDGCSATCQVEDGFVCTDAIPGDLDQVPPVPPVPSQCFVQLDCSIAADIACGETVTGDNSTGVNTVGQYCNGDQFANGPELAYVFTLAEETDVNAVMNIAGGADLDLYLLGSCNQLDCIDSSIGVSSTETVGGCLPAGTYYLVADGVDATDTSAFTLSLDCLSCDPVPVEETSWSKIKDVHR